MLSVRFLRVVQSIMSKLRIALFATIALPVGFRPGIYRQTLTVIFLKKNATPMSLC
jgi:hypothetical protein